MKKKRNGRSGKLPGLRKMVLMMKLCVFFLFASFLSVAANGYSQNTRLSLMKQNASVIEVLTEISQKTDMQFLYNDNELQGIQVNVSLKNATLHEMLDKIFAGLPLSYSILDSVHLLYFLLYHFDYDCFICLFEPDIRRQFQHFQYLR